MSNSALKRILVADSEQEVRLLLKDFFVGLGYQADVAESSQDVLNKAAAEDCAVALVDCHLSGNSGLEVLTELSASRPEVSVIMLSAEPSLQTVIAALRKGAFDFVIKPVDFDELSEITQRACDRHELAKLHTEVSVQMRHLRDAGGERGAVPRAAASESADRATFVHGLTEVPPSQQKAPSIGKGCCD